ncbi:DMT family transporter [Legionella waltersii]|uniref:Integral membrane protein n=1 Tax=Legionella waltersii TaxID=66969 RepID=A0A0W1AMK1_9GAMM|nr:DMT family transporter [Legionella waltersii]KTD82510.1 integral membrane protein [Legionella waltersii]SNV02968.1 permease, DMT superfamily [Legionella waltersii]
MNSHENRGSIYAILSGFLYGFIGYFGLNAINGNMSASNMLFWRFLIASLLVFVILLPQLKHIKESYRSLFIAFLTGALYYGISTLLYFFASLYIGSGLSMVIFFTYPVMIMLLNYFIYGQRIPAVYYLATVFILVGMIFLIDTGDVAFNLLGIGLGLISALFYAFYMISTKNNQLNPTISTFMVSLGCMTTSFFVSIFSNSFAIPGSLSVWYNLFGIAIIATIIPIVLLIHSLKYISSEKASILSVLEPVFVVIFGVLLLGEELKSWNVIGIVLILAGALLTLFSHKVDVDLIKRKFIRAFKLDSDI